MHLCLKEFQKKSHTEPKIQNDSIYVINLINLSAYHARTVIN